MGRMAVVVDTGKHQRCNPEAELKLASASLMESYPFSSSESTLAPLRNNNVSSSWHPELGGRWLAQVYISMAHDGGKGVPKIVGWVQIFGVGMNVEKLVSNQFSKSQNPRASD